MAKKKLGGFFGVSLGVGHPMNVTVFALRVLNSVSCLFVPKSDKDKRSQALDRIKKMPVHLEDKEVIELYMPMKRGDLQKYWLEAKESVKDRLLKGKDCAFAGIGDLLHYGTFYYIERLLKEEGFETMYVPGVTSYQAMSSSIGEPLVQGEESLLVIPDDNIQLEKLVEIDTIVFLKRPSNIKLFDNLTKSHRLFLGEKIGLRGEKIGEIENVEEDLKNLSYFSLIIAKKRR